jgi:hypothetical protein
MNLFQPGARLDSRLSAAPWTPRAVARRRAFTTAAIGILTLALLTAFTPQGRAFAQSLLRFFVRAENEVRLVPTLHPTIVDAPANSPQPTLTSQFVVARLPFQDTCGSTISPACSPAQIREMVAFPIKELASLPEGWNLVGATGGPELVHIVYRSQAGTLELSQSPSAFPEQFTWPVGSTANVETVTIGTETGEYVQGMWVDPGQNTGSVAWDASIPQRTLRWETGDIRYTLRFLPAKSDEGIEPDKAMLAGFAAQLTSVSPFAQLPKPTPIINIEAVAAQAGFPVSAPSWLPERFALVNAAYIPSQNTVCLYYSHPGSEHFANLVIIESQRTLKLEDILLPPQFYNGIQIEIPVHTENVSLGGAQNGQALYASNGLDINTLCGSQALTSNHALLWQSGGKSYIVSAMLNAYDGRSFLTRLEMRRVAEGLTGVSTIPAGTLDPGYMQSVADAETLAGFDIKSPSQMPSDIRFAYAVYRSADAPVSPVSMANGSGEVILAYFGSSLDSIERRHGYLIFQNTVPPNTLEEMAQGGGEWVTVNGLPAVYSQGCWDETSNGGDATCSLSLSWLDENGIRFDINAYLPGALEKEILIAIAESMH